MRISEQAIATLITNKYISMSKKFTYSSQ